MEDIVGLAIFVVVAGSAALLITIGWLIVRVRNLSSGLAEMPDLRRTVDRLKEQIASLQAQASSPNVQDGGSKPEPSASATLDTRPVPSSYVLRPVRRVATPPDTASDDLAAERVGSIFAAAPPPPPASPSIAPVGLAPRETAPVGAWTSPVAAQPAARIQAGDVPVAPQIGTESVRPPAPASPASRASLEERLGHNWLNKLGIITLVIGIALFLGYQLRTLGPMGKSAVGFGLSLVLLGGGIWLERKARYRIFARASIGGGWALLFFVSFAIYHIDATKVLGSQAIDLVLMLLVAIGMVVHSLRYCSQVVTGLAFLLAFVTVGISQVTMFSLLAGALLVAGLVFVVARYAWFELGLAGMVGAYVNHYLWLQRVLPNGGQVGRPFPEFAASAGLLVLYWLSFRILYVLRAPQDERQRVVSSLSAFLNSVGLLSLLKYQSSHPEWAFWGLLILGVAEMALAFVGRRRWRGSFVLLSIIASVLLIAAIPFRFTGAPWTLLWLLEAEVLFVAGLRMREIVFRRMGLLAALVAAVQAVILQAPPIYQLRATHPDISHHSATGLTLLLVAAVLWFNGEFAPRRWVDQLAEDIEHTGTLINSCIAVVVLMVGLWVLLPGSWTAVAWLTAAVLLGMVADRIISPQLAAESDLLAVAGILRLLLINFGDTRHVGGLSLRAITISISAALLYIAMRRKTRAVPAAWNYVAEGYSWAAAALVAGLFWYELRLVSVAVAWAGYGLVLFEVGATLRRGYLRQQGYALLAASFVRMFFANLGVAGTTPMTSPRVYTVVPLIAAFVWIYERSRSVKDTSRLDEVAGVTGMWMGIVAAMALLYFEVRPELVLDAWAALAVILLGTGWMLHRPLFTAQALVVLLAATVRASLFNLLSPTPLAGSAWTSRTGTVVLACTLMLLALPVCFALRRTYALEATNGDASLGPWLLGRPEQPFFFVPLALGTALLTVVLRAGMITVGWSSLGLAVFLFALTVGERSYRLAGLGLLLAGLCKVYTVDVWRASSIDKYLTLIVTGAALLLVSFLYSRYRERILKLL